MRNIARAEEVILISIAEYGVRNQPEGKRGSQEAKSCTNIIVFVEHCQDACEEGNDSDEKTCKNSETSQSLRTFIHVFFLQKFLHAIQFESNTSTHIEPDQFKFGSMSPIGSLEGGFYRDDELMKFVC